MNNSLDKQYQALLQDILDNGVKKEDRTGTGTLSVFGRQIRHKMSEGFPLLTTKKMYFKGVLTELLWFLRGDTNIKYLVDNDCHIWDGDAYKRYFETVSDSSWKYHNRLDLAWQIEVKEPDPRGQVGTIYRHLNKEEFINKIKTDPEFAKKWGELGPIYGKMWRDWDADTGEKIDQIQNLINDLKKNPDSRRLMVNAWNCTYIPHMVLPPCHYGFQMYTRELSWEERRDLLTEEQFRDEFGYLSPFTEPIINYYLDSKNIPKRAISLMWNQRSVDTFLGLPFNIASYGLLLEIVAKEVNMVPDELIGNLGDTHLYLNHIEQAKDQIGRDLTLEEREEIFKQRGYVHDLWPFAGDWHSEFDGFGIPRRTREPYPLPKLRIKHITDNQMIYPKLIPTTGEEEEYEISDFILEGYQSHPPIKAPLSN